MRLDLALVENGLARSRSHAAQLIKAERVRIRGTIVTRAATPVADVAEIDVDTDAYVSRAAYKLLGALQETGVTVPARVLDAGASTGGFTQVLLEHGARRVYAIDVGHDQLAPQLRNDPRVVVGERINLRELAPEHVENNPVDLLVADVSFISLTLVLPRMLAVLSERGQALVLVKPQFEVGKDKLGRGGVVRSESLRREAIDAVVACAAGLGWSATAVVPSRLPGPAGNLEYFVRLRRMPPLCCDG